MPDLGGSRLVADVDAALGRPPEPPEQMAPAETYYALLHVCSPTTNRTTKYPE